jgi:hypothetical protein
VPARQEEEKEEEKEETVRVGMGGLFNGIAEQEAEAEAEAKAEAKAEAQGATVLLENVSWWWWRLRGGLVSAGGDCRGQTPVFCALQRVYSGCMSLI